MTEFKVGDKVRRKDGFTSTIESIDGSHVKFERDTSVWDSSSLKMVQPHESTGEERKDAKPVDFELDFGLLRNAAGSPGPWASEMARLVRTVAGVEFAAESFEPLLTAFSRQAAAAAKRSLALEVANQQVVNAGSADTLSGALQFRNMLSERLLMESAS